MLRRLLPKLKTRAVWGRFSSGDAARTRPVLLGTPRQPRPLPPALAARKLSLRTLLILPFAIQTVAVVALVGYWSYRSGQRAVEDLAGQLMAEIGDRVAQRVDRSLALPQRAARSSATLLEDGSLDGNDLAGVERHFFSQMRTFPNLSGLALSNEAGDFLSLGRTASDGRILRVLDASDPDRPFYRYETDRNGRDRRLTDTFNDYDPHADPPSNPWYLQTRSNPQGTWRFVVTLADGRDRPKLSLVYSVPFYDARGRFQGAVSAALFLPQIGDWLRGLNASQAGQVFLLDRDGLLVATSTGELPFDPSPRDRLTETLEVDPRRLAAIDSRNPLTAATAHWLAGVPAREALPQANRLGEAQLRSLQWNGQRYFVRAVPLEGDLGWRAVVVVPESEFLAEIHASWRRTALLALLVLAGISASGAAIYRRIARPLRRLTEAARALAEGRSLPALPDSSIAEVEILSAAVRQLQTDLAAADRLRQRYTEDLERQVAEQTAALSEAQRIARVGSWEFDLRSRTTTWSEELYRLHGLDPTAAPLTPETMPGCVHPDDRDRYQREVVEPSIAGQPFDADLRLLTQQGTLRYIHAKGRPVLDDRGELVKLRGVVADITERKQAELFLQQALQELNYHVEHTPLATIRWDREFRVEAWSKRAEAMFGWAEDEVVGLQPFDWPFIVEVDVPGVRRVVDELLRGRCNTWENRNYCKNGSTVHCEWYNSVLVDEAGQLVSVLSLAQDVSDRKRLEADLIQSRDFREQIFNESSDALFLVDPETLLVLDCNRRAASLFEVASPAELTGIAFHTFQRRPFSSRDLDAIQVAIARTGFWTVEVEYLTRQGREFWGDLSVKPMTFSDRHYHLVRVADISSRKRAEADLKQAKKQLEARLTDLERRDREIVLLGEMAELLRSCVTLDEACRTIQNLLKLLFPDCSGGLFLFDADREWLESVASWGRPAASVQTFQESDCWALRRRRSHWVANWGPGSRCHHLLANELAASTLCIPLAVQREILGVLHLTATLPDALGESQRQLARTIAEYLALAIANLQLRDQLHQQRILDPLTGLFNRRHLEEFLARELQRARRRQEPVGLVLLAVDRFSPLVQRYGRAAGDAVLQAIARLLRQQIRASDIACRYGDEKMVLILPGTSLEEAFRRAEEIRRAISDLAIDLPEFAEAENGEKPTASCGVASFPEQGDSATAVVAAALAALRRAGLGSYNCTVVADSSADRFPF